MNIFDEAIEIWTENKKRLEKMNLKYSVPYGDWTYHKDEVLKIALKIYYLQKINNNERDSSYLFSKKKSAWL